MNYPTQPVSGFDHLSQASTISNPVDSDHHDEDLSNSDRNSVENSIVPLRVLFLITSMPVGGAETLLLNLVRRMDVTRFQPEICCLKDAGPLGETIRDQIPFHSNFINHKYDFRVLGRLKKLLRERCIDALITVGAGDKMFWGRLAARQARVPVVLSALHSTGWPDGIGRINRTLTGITDGFIAVAKSHGKFLVDFERFPSEKVHVIPNGIDTERFKFSTEKREFWRRKLGIPCDVPVCGIVAALRPEKNHLLFLRSAALTLKQTPDAHFMIVGDGPELEKLEMAVQENCLQPRVHFAGSCSDVPGILSSMDMFALSSQNEASPVSILEAMSCARPVVATDVGSISESVLHGKTGYLVDSGDAVAMSQNWCKVLANKTLQTNLGEAARRHVVDNASLKVMVDGYECLIESIYTKKRPATS